MRWINKTRSSIPCSTHSPFALQKLGIPNQVVWATNNRSTKPRVRILASRELSQRELNCTKSNAHTQPINWNLIPQKDTMILYIAQTRHLLNNQILSMFPPFTTMPTTPHYSGFANWSTFSTKWYVIVFYIFYVFYNLAHILSQYISWIKSLIQPRLHHLHLYCSIIQQILPTI